MRSDAKPSHRGPEVIEIRKINPEAHITMGINVTIHVPSVGLRQYLQVLQLLNKRRTKLKNLFTTQ